jgi:site-specific DNA recombinase
MTPIKQRGAVSRPCQEPATHDSREAVLYARVSSKEQELGYSMPAQQELLRSYAAPLSIRIAQEFGDAETAKTTGRPGFAAMVSYLKQRPRCRILLVEKTDRLYRNFKDYLTIDDLGVDIHLVKENVILTQDSRSSEKFMHGIKVLMAKNYIDNLREEVRKGLHTKAAQGLFPSFAPLGYVNVAGADGKRVIAPDPVLGPMIQTLFTWFASGECSLKALTAKAFDAGFRFRNSGNKVPTSTLHRILRKRIYTGEFDYAGKTYQGSHEPLVTREMWEKVQEILSGRHEKKHRKAIHHFAFSGLVDCGHCGCSLVGEIKKKRYVYYHCTGYRGKCAEPYTREAKLEQQFAEGLRELVIPNAILDWLQEELVASDLSEHGAREQALRRDQAELDRVQNRLDVLYEDRLDGRIDAGTYDRKAGEMRQQQDRLRRRLAEVPSLPHVSQAVDLMAITAKTADLFLKQPGVEQRKLLRLVLSGATWKGGELRMSFREPFAQLRLSNSESRTKDSHLNADESSFDIWRRGGDSNPR